MSPTKTLPQTNSPLHCAAPTRAREGRKGFLPFPGNTAPNLIHGGFSLQLDLSGGCELSTEPCLNPANELLVLTQLFPGTQTSGQAHRGPSGIVQRERRINSRTARFPSRMGGGLPQRPRWTAPRLGGPKPSPVGDASLHPARLAI